MHSRVRHLIRRGCLASVLILALSGCSGSKAAEEPQPGPENPSAMEEPMVLVAWEQPSESRATGLETLCSDFAVVCSKTNAQGAKEYVMSGDASGNSPYLVQYTAGQGWHYADLSKQYLKYWDLSASAYDFYAIADYEKIKQKYQDASFDNGYLTIPQVKGHESTPTVELLESQYRREASPLADYDMYEGMGNACYQPQPSGYRPAMADKVPLVFHHVMSHVRFLIYDTNGNQVALNHVKITVPTSEEYGIYTQATYKAAEFIEYVSSSLERTICDMELTDVYTGKDKDHPSLLFASVELPQILRQAVDIEITAENGSYFGTIDLGNTANSNRWAKGKVYNYMLVVHTGGDIILVDIDVDEWVLDDDPQEAEQTNW